MAVGLLAPDRAAAHSLSRSDSLWRFSGSDVHVSASIPLVEVARRFPAATGLTVAALLRHPTLPRRIAAEIASDLRLLDTGAACTASEPLVAAGQGVRLRVRWTLACERPPAVHLRLDRLFDAAPGHLHAVTVVRGPDARPVGALLTHSGRELDLRTAGAPPPRSLLETVLVGVRHVLAGPDHVAFVVALVLLALTLAPGTRGGGLAVVGIATGFTLGHSVTLALAALGVARVDSGGVEVLVGVSIVYAALACFHAWLGPAGKARVVALNLALHAALLAAVPPVVALGSALFTTCHLALERRRGAGGATSLRFVLAALFGLVHGFAFAGAFAELLGGGAGLLRALLGFNLGVELGQLGVIALATAALALVRRPWRLPAAAGAAAVILALGVMWTVSRATW